MKLLCLLALLWGLLGHAHALTAVRYHDASGCYVPTGAPSQASLQAAIDELTWDACLLLPRTTSARAEGQTWAITSALTIPARIRIHAQQGGPLLQPAAGIRLTMACPEAGPYQVFDADNVTTGEVRFLAGTCGSRLEAAWWGVVADCTTPTDTHDTLQAAINAAMLQKPPLHLAHGCYYVADPLYLSYDAVNNPTPSQVDGNTGQLKLEGDGYMSTDDAQEDNRNQGTVIVSGHATGPAILLTDPLASQHVEYVELTNLSIIATNTTAVIEVDSLDHGVGFSRMFVEQKGTGNGLDLDNATMLRLEDVFVFGADDASGSGIGIWLHHTTNPSALVKATMVTSRRFPTCWLIGDSAPPSTSVETNIRDVHLDGSQATGCGVGIDIGTRAGPVLITNSHNEKSLNIGYRIRHYAESVTIWGGTVGCNEHTNGGTDACIQIGDMALAGTDQGARNISIGGGLRINNVQNIGIDIQPSQYVYNIDIGAVALLGAHAAAVGINCNDHNLQGVRLLRPEFDVTGTTFGTEMDGCERVTWTVGQQHVQPGSLVLGTQSLTTIAAAATITPNCSGNHFVLTGTDTIATINTTTTCGEVLTPGTVITLRVDTGEGPVTVTTTGGNLQLNGAGSHTLAAGDVIELMLGQTRWRDVGLKQATPRPRIPSGSAPPATCQVGEVFLDTEEGVDTGCTTTADNALCVCVATDTWVSNQ